MDKSEIPPQITTKVPEDIAQALKKQLMEVRKKLRGVQGVDLTNEGAFFHFENDVLDAIRKHDKKGTDTAMRKVYEFAQQHGTAVEASPALKKLRLVPETEDRPQDTRVVGVSSLPPGAMYAVRDTADNGEELKAVKTPPKRKSSFFGFKSAPAKPVEVAPEAPAPVPPIEAELVPPPPVAPVVAAPQPVQPPAPVEVQEVPPEVPVVPEPAPVPVSQPPFLSARPVPPPSLPGQGDFLRRQFDKDTLTPEEIAALPDTPEVKERLSEYRTQTDLMDLLANLSGQTREEESAPAPVKNTGEEIIPRDHLFATREEPPTKPEGTVLEWRQKLRGLIEGAKEFGGKAVEKAGEVIGEKSAQLYSGYLSLRQADIAASFTEMFSKKEKKEESTAMKDRLAYLSGRLNELGQKASATSKKGFETYLKVSEAYSKMPIKYKLAISAGLVGTGFLAGGVGPLVMALGAAKGTQRALVAGGVYVAVQALMEKKYPREVEGSKRDWRGTAINHGVAATAAALSLFGGSIAKESSEWLYHTIADKIPLIPGVNAPMPSGFAPIEDSTGSHAGIGSDFGADKSGLPYNEARPGGIGSDYAADPARVVEMAPQETPSTSVAQELTAAPSAEAPVPTSGQQFPTIKSIPIEKGQGAIRIFRDLQDEVIRQVQSGVDPEKLSPAQRLILEGKDPITLAKDFGFHTPGATSPVIFAGDQIGFNANGELTYTHDGTATVVSPEHKYGELKIGGAAPTDLSQSDVEKIIANREQEIGHTYVGGIPNPLGTMIDANEPHGYTGPNGEVYAFGGDKEALAAFAQDHVTENQSVLVDESYEHDGVKFPRVVEYVFNGEGKPPTMVVINDYKMVPDSNTFTKRLW